MACLITLVLLGAGLLPLGVGPRAFRGMPGAARLTTAALSAAVGLGQPSIDVSAQVVEFAAPYAVAVGMSRSAASPS